MDDPMPSLRAFAASLEQMDGMLEERFLKHKELETYISSLNDQDLSPLQKAQNATMLAYLIYDCIWMWLRTKGVEPSKHPILSELDRIKGFFAKIQKAEQGRDQPMKLDKDAAGRLLRQPMKDAQVQPAPKQTKTSHEIGTTTRFNAAAQAVAYHDQASDRAQAKIAARPTTQDVSSGSESNDSDLEVFDTLVQSKNSSPSKPTGATSSSSESHPTPSPQEQHTAEGTSDKKKKRKRSKSKHTDASAANSSIKDSVSSSGVSQPEASAAAPAKKKARRRKNKT